MRKMFFSFLLMIMVTPMFVLAADDAATTACNTYKTAHNDGVVTFKAVSPSNLAQTERFGYIQALTSQASNEDVFSFMSSGFNSDYSKITIKIKDGKADLDGTACELTVKWTDYDEANAAAVNTAINNIQKTAYTDLYNLSYFYYHTKEIKQSIFYYPNIEKVETTNVKFVPANLISCSMRETYVNGRDCGVVDDAAAKALKPETDTLNRVGCVAIASYQIETVGNGCFNHLLVTYDDVAYNVISDPKFYLYSVLYIPEFTKGTTEDYLSELKTRVAAELDKDYQYEVIDVSKDDSMDTLYYKSMLDYGKNHGYIDSSLNSDFAPIYVKLTNSKAESERNYIVAKAAKSVVLNEASDAYVKYYEAKAAQVSEVVPIPDTAAFLPKLLLIFGVVSLVVGVIIVFTPKVASEN